MHVNVVSLHTYLLTYQTLVSITLQLHKVKPDIMEYRLLPLVLHIHFFHNKITNDYLAITVINKKLSWCWQTRATCLEVSQGHQT